MKTTEKLEKAEKPYMFRTKYMLYFLSTSLVFLVCFSLACYEIRNRYGMYESMVCMKTYNNNVYLLMWYLVFYSTSHEDFFTLQRQESEFAILFIPKDAEELFAYFQTIKTVQA